MAKLKKLVKENFSLVGGVVSTPAINTGYSSLSNIAEMAATHTVQETEDWFDKVTVSRNMKELTNHSK